jgi:hypothetical protein
LVIEVSTDRQYPMHHKVGQAETAAMLIAEHMMTIHPGVVVTAVLEVPAEQALLDLTEVKEEAFALRSMSTEAALRPTAVAARVEMEDLEDEVVRVALEVQVAGEQIAKPMPMVVRAVTVDAVVTAARVAMAAKAAVSSCTSNRI